MDDLRVQVQQLVSNVDRLTSVASDLDRRIEVYRELWTRVCGFGDSLRIAAERARRRDDPRRAAEVLALCAVLFDGACSGGGALEPDRGDIACARCVMVGVGRKLEAGDVAAALAELRAHVESPARHVTCFEHYLCEREAKL